MFTFSIIVMAAVLFLAMVVNLAMKPSSSAKFTAILMLISVTGGLILYGIGFSEVLNDPFQAIIRTSYSVMGMFLGKNELSAISGSTLITLPGVLLLFWTLHLMAFYTTASAAMITVGAEALRQLRIMLASRGDLTLIYGVNERCLAIGKESHAKVKGAVVFVAESAPASLVSEINNRGMSVLTGYAAVNSDDRIIKKLRPEKRKITVYALETEPDKNLFYALKLRDALEKAGVPAENTRITLPGAEDIIASMLQVSPEQYGFGFVYVFEKPNLAARAMIKLCPPWETVKFGPDGCAQEDFYCVVVGFGQYGQAALKQLVMNAQFAGSTFRAAVFAKDYRSESGYMTAESPELFNQYEIKGYNEDARSSAFYEFIGERLSLIKMIAVCTGSEGMNSEISDHLMLFLKRRGAENICVLQCGRNGVRYQQTLGSPIQRADIFTLSMLSAEIADRRAIVLNSTYDSSERSDWEKWVDCDAFSKMSSRASADFMPAFLKAAGKTREEVIAGDWNLSRELQNTLGETEHKRWCAFHYAMGYAPMTEEVFSERAQKYKELADAGNVGRFRVSKDTEGRVHACLIPWEELPDLDRREFEATGKEVDYQQTDINNVMALPDVLRAE